MVSRVPSSTLGTPTDPPPRCYQWKAHDRDGQQHAWIVVPTSDSEKRTYDAATRHMDDGLSEREECNLQERAEPGGKLDAA